MPFASRPLPSIDLMVSKGWKSLGMSLVKSFSRVGPKQTTRLISLPGSAQVSRSLWMTDLTTLRSAPSTRLRCTYHWCSPMLRLRIACGSGERA